MTEIVTAVVPIIIITIVVEITEISFKKRIVMMSPQIYSAKMTWN